MQKLTKDTATKGTDQENRADVILTIQVNKAVSEEQKQQILAHFQKCVASFHDIGCELNITQ